MRMRVAQDVILLAFACALISTISHAETKQRLKRQIVFPDAVPRVGSSCVTPDKRDGQCVLVTDCPVLLQLNNFNRLRRFFCGFEDEVPKVCCPEGSVRAGTTAPTPRPATPPNRTREPTPTPTRRTPPPRTPSRRPVTPPPRPATPPTVPGRSKPDFLPADCGQSNTTKTRVVGGREAEKGAWPWMAVVYQTKRGGRKSPDCGGALVSRSHVVTAAHCVVGRGIEPLSPSVLSVRLGEHDLYSENDGMNPVDVNVRSVRRHDQFDPRTYRNDIAVLLLERPVEFNTDIQPICLPYDSLRDEDLSSRNGFVSGWGTTSFNGPSSNVLREVSFPIVEDEFCRDAYRQDLPITDVYICAGTADGSKDSCQGDSGGPLMLPGRGTRYYLVGIVSFGKRCAEPGYPGVYTRVTKFLDWLTQNLSS